MKEGNLCSKLISKKVILFQYSMRYLSNESNSLDNSLKKSSKNLRQWNDRNVEFYEKIILLSFYQVDYLNRCYNQNLSLKLLHATSVLKIKGDCLKLKNKYLFKKVLTEGRIILKKVIKNLTHLELPIIVRWFQQRDEFKHFW